MRSPDAMRVTEKAAAHVPSAFLVGCLLMALSVSLAGSGPATAAEKKPAHGAAVPRSESPAVKGPVRPGAAAGKTQGTSIAQDYCQAVRDAAREARHAVHLRQLEDLKTQLDAQLARIDVRVAELKDWFVKREEFANRVGQQLVGIYAVMRPEAASAQLTKMDEATAAAILSKLEARVAGAILNDMAPDVAARLVTILSAASRRKDAGAPKAEADVEPQAETGGKS